MSWVPFYVHGYFAKSFIKENQNFYNLLLNLILELFKIKLYSKSMVMRLRKFLFFFSLEIPCLIMGFVGVFISFVALIMHLMLFFTIVIATGGLKV